MCCSTWGFYYPCVVVLVDITLPVSGVVMDGPDIRGDIAFTSNTAVVASSWTNFSDPESGIAFYTLAVFVNNILLKTFSPVLGETFRDSSFSLKHGDFVYIKVEATNRSVLSLGPLPPKRE